MVRIWSSTDDLARERGEGKGSEKEGRRTAFTRTVRVGRVGAEDDVVEWLSTGESGEEGAKEGETGSAGSAVEDQDATGRR